MPKFSDYPETLSPDSDDFFLITKNDGTLESNRVPFSTVTFDNPIATYDYYVTTGDWGDLVIALESGLYTTISIPKGTYTCTDDEANPIVVHANVKRISGADKAEVILDANCAANTNIQDFISNVSKDCVIENITIKNYGTNGWYYAIKGSSPVPWGQCTKVVNCKFTDVVVGQGAMIGYSDVFSCEGINDSSIGGYGRGMLANYCWNVLNCKTEYFYTIAKGSKNVLNNYVYKGGNAIDSCSVVNDNYIYSAYRGIFHCENVGYANRFHTTDHADYEGCSFNNTYRDNTDNTKELTLDYSEITTGTERTQTFQDKDGTIALLGDWSKEYDYYVTAGDWSDLVNALESGLYATVFIPNGTYTCTDDEANPIVVHSNVKRISGASRENTIIDFNGAVNTNIVSEITLHKNCCIENLTVTRPTALVSDSWVFLGERGADDTHESIKMTIANNILVTDPQGSMARKRAFYYCSGSQWYVDGNNKMGGAKFCDHVTNFQFLNCLWGMESCSYISNFSIKGDHTYRMSIGLLQCNYISNFYLTHISSALYNCGNVINGYLYDCTIAVRQGYNIDNLKIYACTNGCQDALSLGNNISMSAVTTEYSNCTFNNTYRDNTDNTKELDWNYFNQTTGAKRTISSPDYDYDIANPTVLTLLAGNTTDGTEFEADGTMVANGDATCWDDIRFPFIGRNLDISSGRIDYDYDELGVNFADNSRVANSEQVSMICQMQHDWKTGSAIKPHLHWIQSSADEPNWLLKYRFYDNGETPPATWTSVIKDKLAYTYSSGSILQITEFPEIDMSSITGVSSFVDFKFYRDTNNTSGLFSGADPLTGNALAKEFDIHYQRDMLGSHEEYVK